MLTDCACAGCAGAVLHVEVRELNTVWHIAAHLACEIAIGALLALLLRCFVCMLVRVKGRSMMDTLQNGDLMLALRYGLFGGIHRFDVVICRYPGRKGYFVKRIVALPGERVSIAEGVLYINGEVIDGGFPLRKSLRGFEERTLGPDEYFVMGDNRPCSHDSRRIGPIPRSAIHARVCCVFWPLRRCRRIRRNVISSRGA